MTELAPDISPEEYFTSPGVKFEVTSSNSSEDKQFAEALKADGDLFCSAEFDEKTNYTQDMIYCGGLLPDIKGDLGSALTTFANVVGDGLVTQMVINFTAGSQATVSMEGHQHDVNPHTAGSLVSFDASSALPASAGLGVPDTLIVVTGDVSPVDASVTISCEHIDKIGADGDHFAGQNRTCKCELSVNYEGTLTAATAGNWLDIKITKSKENTDTPTSSLTAVQYFDQN